MTSINDLLPVLLGAAIIIAIHYRSKYVTYKNKFLHAREMQIRWFNKYKNQCAITDELNKKNDK